MTNLRQKLVLGFIFGLLVVAGLLLYADLTQVADSLGDFTWAYLPLILGLTLSNYALRFVKWHYYLGLVGVSDISILDSLLVFVGGGVTMVFSPGKVGELVKSLALKDLTGAPISQTAPVVMAERLSDGLAMLLLAGTATLLIRFFTLWFAVALGLGVLVLFRRRLFPEQAQS